MTVGARGLDVHRTSWIILMTPTTPEAAMSIHTVKGFILYPFEAQVEISDDEAGDYSVARLLEAVGARDGSHFGRLAFAGDDIWVQDHEAEVSITEVSLGGIEWVDDGLPVSGIADGRGGATWQESDRTT